MPPRKSADLLQGTLDMLILRVAAVEPIHGYAIAQRNLATLYERGLGGARDLKQAKAWMRKAAEGGDDAARQWVASH